MTGRFATVEEVNSKDFHTIWTCIDILHKTYQLPDHTDVNLQRYPWSSGLLTAPVPYASRLWEYPFAVLGGEVKPGMHCADIGCGMTAFTPYLKNICRCDVIGIDSVLFESGIKYKGHGVSKEFLERTNIEFRKSSVTHIDAEDNEFDRIFCISVIEHLPRIIIPQAIREMSRILRPDGLLVLTMDVNIFSDISNPLDLIWQSGLVPYGILDLNWPKRRFGIFNNNTEPADVYGLVLAKPVRFVDMQFTGRLQILQSDIPEIRQSAWNSTSLPLKVRRTLKKYIIGR